MLRSAETVCRDVLIEGRIVMTARSIISCVHMEPLRRDGWCFVHTRIVGFALQHGQPVAETYLTKLRLLPGRWRYALFRRRCAARHFLGRRGHSGSLMKCHRQRTVELPRKQVVVSRLRVPNTLDARCC